MNRSQLQRIAAATLVAIVGLVGTSALGVWQYSRAHRDDISKQVLAAAPVPVESLIVPGHYVLESNFAREVLVSGKFIPDLSMLTCERVESGLHGCWVIAPVLVDHSRIGMTVVLGFVKDAEAERALAEIRASEARLMTFRGRLQPGEVIERTHAILRPAARVPYIAVNELAQRWNSQMLDGYVVLEPSQLSRAIDSPLILPPSGITWRNLVYAWQWWAFTAFIAFLLFRYIVEVRAEQSHTISESQTEEQP